MTIKTKVICMILLSSALPLMASTEHHEGYNWEFFTQWLVNASIFFGGLAYILRKPVGEFFTNRRKDISESLSRAEQSRKDAVLKLREIDEMSSALEKEVANILAQATQDASREKARLIALAEEEAVKIGEQARAEIENMSHAAKSELKAFLADLAVKEAEKVITSTITDTERKALFANFSARLEAKS